MAWAEPVAGGFRGRYRDASGRQQTVLDGGLPFGRKRDAREAATEEEVKARRRAKTKSRTSAKLTWGEWWDRIAPDRETGWSDTARTEQGYVDVHIRPHWDSVPLNQIESADVRKWVRKLIKTRTKKGSTLAPTTVRRIFGVFSMSIHAAIDEEILESSPLVKPGLPEVPKQPKQYTTHASLKPYLTELRPDYARAVEFLLETGLRPSELGGLHHTEVEDGWLIVWHVLVDRTGKIRPWPKNKRVRKVPLTERAMEIVAAAIDGRDMTLGCGLEHTDGRTCRSELVFRTDRERPVWPHNLRQRLAYVAESKGLEYRAPYAARRGFITWAAPGVDELALQKIAGHSSRDQTAGYHQLTPEERERLRSTRGKITAPGADSGAHLDQERLDEAGVDPPKTGR